MKIERFNAGHIERFRTTMRAFSNWPSLFMQMATFEIGRGPDVLTAITRRGTVIRCPMPSRSAVFTVYGDDIFGLREVKALLERRGQPVHQIVDVGAHVGTFSLLAMEEFPAASCTCFEPSPTGLNYLRQNIQANGLSERVTIEPHAVAAQAGSTLLSERVPGGLASTIDSEVAGQESYASSIPVETVAFDSVVEGLDSHIDVLKLNCEGAEYEILGESNPAMLARVQAIVLEYHPIPGKSWDQLRAHLEGQGFTLIHDQPLRPGMGIASLARS